MSAPGHQPPEHRPVIWAERSWEELPGDLARAGEAAMLPVGATEQHGPHLGCGADFVLAERLCLDVSALTRVPVLPTLPYGSSQAQSRRWPGTLTLDPLLLAQLVVQLGAAAHRSGVRRLFLVNGHGGNAAPLRCALDMLRAGNDGLMVALVNTGEMSERVREAHRADAADWHANAAETSLMLALAPAMARPDRLASSDDPDRTCGLVFAHPVNRTSRNGVTGRPSGATAAAGGRLYAMMIEDLAGIVRAGLVEEPPLPHGLDERAVGFERARPR